MNSLKQVIAQKNRIPNIKDLLSACEAYEFDSSNDDGPIHRMMHQLRNLDFSKKMKRKMVYTLMDIDYFKSFLTSSTGTRGSGEGHQECWRLLFRGQQQGNVRRQLVNYLTKTSPNARLSSSTCLYATIAMMRRGGQIRNSWLVAFMIPRVGKGYDLYYVNHHGEAMDGTLDMSACLREQGIKIFLQATSRFHRAGPNRQVYEYPIEGDHLLWLHHPSQLLWY